MLNALLCLRTESCEKAAFNRSAARRVLGMAQTKARPPRSAYCSAPQRRRATKPTSAEWPRWPLPSATSAS